jgi:hypothetical protein
MICPVQDVRPSAKNNIMVELTRRERKLVDRLERRLALLTDRIAASPHKDMSPDVQDRAALLWLLEVAERAADLNCTEAFTRTSFRNQIVDVAAATAAYLRRSQQRKQARKQERATQGLPAESPDGGSEME